jgi:DNA-binding HxlR family transcriptional regulator
MLGRRYEGENCSAARALELVGERWSLLILRDAMYAGSTRFNQFQRSLGIASNVLSARLDWFVESGLMESTAVPGGTDTHEYVLTSKGRDFEPVIVALSGWGDQWAAPDGPPIEYHHDHCGGQVRQRLECETCHESLHPGEIVAALGPGMPAAS